MHVPGYASDTAPQDLASLPAFEMLFALHLECESCVEAVRNAVIAVPGIISANPSLETQTLRTQGTAAPSAILAAIQSTGRDAVVRGTGSSSASGADGSAAAVAILEDYDIDDYMDSPVRGLARIVQLRSSPSTSSSLAAGGHSKEEVGAAALSVVDVSLSGLSPGVYAASVRTSGDISRGSKSVGGSWRDITSSIIVGEDGRGSAVVVASGWEVWEIVGRAFAVERVSNGDAEDKGTKMALGVIARSAGVWDNDKMVCSCSGKTVWEERVEQKNRGML